MKEDGSEGNPPPCKGCWEGQLPVFQHLSLELEVVGVLVLVMMG